MKNLFVIFAATIGFAKFVLFTLLFSITLVLVWGVGYTYYDYEEVRLRNLIVAQQQIVETTDSAVERVKLIEYNCQYETLRGTWHGRLFLGGR